MNRQELETELGLELPNSFEKYDEIIKESLIKYLQHLNTIEKQAYTIGKQHLGSSFNVLKSNGYINWKKNN
jgi:competence protein ComGC